MTIIQDIAASAATRQSKSRLGMSTPSWVTYVEQCLPGGAMAFGLPYHSRRFDPSTKRMSAWLRRGLLDFATAQRHLSGKEVVAVVWPAHVNCFEFDLDRKRLDTEPWWTVLARLDSIRSALGLEHHPGILWRSSSGSCSHGQRWPGGVRWRVYLDDYVDAVVLRAAISDLLNAAGVALTPGEIELWPNGGTCNRLPLGTGSDLIDLNGAPLTANEVYVACPPHWVHDEDGEAQLVAVRPTLHRRLGIAINTWADRAAKAISASQLIATPTAQATAPKTRGTTTWKKSDGRPIPVAQAARKTNTRTIPGPTTERGQRNATFGKLLCRWYSGRGLSRKETLIAAEAWLRQDGHVGDLAADNPRREQVITSMLRGVPKDLDRQDEKVRMGKLRRGARASRSTSSKNYSTPCLSLFQVVVPLISVDGGGWRNAARSYLNDSDRDRVATIADKWTRIRIDVLVGLLRFMEELNGSMPWVAIDVRALERIASKRKRKGQVAYKALLLAARRAGYLGRAVVVGAMRKTATVYEVALAPVLPAPKVRTPPTELLAADSFKSPPSGPDGHSHELPYTLSRDAQNDRQLLSRHVATVGNVESTRARH